MDKRTKRVLGRTVFSMTGLFVMALSWLLSIGVWQILGVSVGLIITGIVIYRFFYTYEEKIDAFEDSRPNLISSARCAVFPVYYDVRETTTTTTSTTISDTSLRFPVSDASYPWLDINNPRVTMEAASAAIDPKANQSWFALVEFRNQPIEPTDNSVAKEVSAHLTYYNKENKPRIKDTGISGRWWSNEEVGHSNKPRKELERTTIFPNSQPVTLALACMGVGKKEIYGYNNDNHEYKNFEKHEFALGAGMYYIHAVLSGIHLKPTDFWFEVGRDTTSGNLIINPIEKPMGIK